MNKKMILCLGTILLLLSACCPDNSKSNPQSYVEVICRAEKEVEPDIFYLGFTLSESKSANISAMEGKMLDMLGSIGVDTKNDLSVTSMSGDNWYWWRKSRSVQQNKSYLLKMKNLELLNRVCDKFDSLGYVNYYLNKADYSEKDKLKQETQREAVKQARIKADNLLSGENKKVDELIYLQEYEPAGYNMRYANYQSEYEQTQDKAITPAVSFNKIKVSYEVMARFSIK